MSNLSNPTNETRDEWITRVAKDFTPECLAAALHDRLHPKKRRHDVEIDKAILTLGLSHQQNLVANRVSPENAAKDASNLEDAIFADIARLRDALARNGCDGYCWSPLDGRISCLKIKLEPEHCDVSVSLGGCPCDRDAIDKATAHLATCLKCGGKKDNPQEFYPNCPKSGCVQPCLGCPNYDNHYPCDDSFHKESEDNE
jgi:hypothetical protein